MQYSMLCRNNTVDIMGIHQYADPWDEFEREPFSVKFRSKDSVQHGQRNNYYTLMHACSPFAPVIILHDVNAIII